VTITPFPQPGRYATWEPYRQAIETTEGVGAVVQAALLAVDHCEAALEHQAAGQTGCWWCFPCAWSAGSPTTPGDPNNRSHLQ
jgi:hypothetical protein